MIKILKSSLAGVLIMLSTLSAQTEPCSDGDGNGFVSVADIVYMLNYVYQGGPPPVDFDHADFDLHQEWTVNDAAMLLGCIFSECMDIYSNCPPTFPAWNPNETPGFRIRHTAAFPGHKTNSIVDFALDAPGMTGLQLPLRILVDTIPALIDSVQFPLPNSAFDGSAVNDVVVSPAPGVVVFGSVLFWNHWGPTQMARVFISAPMDTASRLINLEFASYVPAQAPPGHNGPITPMISTWNVPVKPSFLGTCCLVPGDADGNGLQSISDAVYLINYYFAGGPSPHSCFALGDADGNGILTISDAVYLINYIFSGGPAPMCT